MKILPTLIVTVVVAAVVAFLVTRFAPAGAPASAGSATYAATVANKTIRCGYVLDAPGTIRDPNTGKMSGVVPEALEVAAKTLHYKIEWTEEVTYSTMVEGLRTKRYDAICAATYYNSTRSQFAEPVTPVYYTLLSAYARSDDHRFDYSLAAVNDPAVKIAVLDGEITSIVASQQFSKASVVALPQQADLSQVLLSVADHKADVTFVESYLADQFLKSHPGTLRNVTGRTPLRTYANVILVRKMDYETKGLLDAMIAEVVGSGDMDRILAKYDPHGDALFPVALPYRHSDQAAGT